MLARLKASLLFDKLTQKLSLAKLIIACFITRSIAIHTLPDTASKLAPDEAIYASLASWVSESKEVTLFPGYGPRLYHESKVFVLPASALIRLGSNEINAVRIVSLTFGLISVFLFYKIALTLLRVRQLEDIDSASLRKLTAMALIIYAFFPSLFIWSILGIKETSSMAATLLCALLLLKIRNTFSARVKPTEVARRILLLIAAPIAIALNFGTRKETALVFIVSFCLVLILTSVIGAKSALLATALSGTLLGLILSATPTPSAEPNKTPSLLKGALEQVPLKTLDELEDKREVNRIGASTALPQTKCIDKSFEPIENLFCNLGELPFRLFSFLVRPLPIMDSGSLLNNLASIENLFWVILLVLFSLGVYLSFRFKLERRNVLPPFAFFIIFSSLAALYEGNLGTAFRHKSIILWTLFLVPLIVVGSDWSQVKKIRQGKSPSYHCEYLK